MVVSQIFIKFWSSERNTGNNTMSHLYFNEESDYSEENTVLGQLPQSKIAPSPNSNTNPKPNPNPDRGAVFLGGNCPDTGKYMWKWSISLHHSPPQKETKHIHASAADVLHTVRNIYIHTVYKFSCEFREIFGNTFFTEHLWATGFVKIHSSAICFLSVWNWTGFSAINFAIICGRRCLQMFFKIGIHNNFETPTQVFFCEYCEIFKNSFFVEHL